MAMVLRRLNYFSDTDSFRQEFTGCTNIKEKDSCGNTVTGGINHGN